MKLELRHLRLVEAVERHGSLTRASAELHLTQSALSHQLRDVERRLKIALFSRVGKRMVLTTAGQRVLRSARVVMAELRAAEDEVERMADGREGVLRISTECYTCYHWLPPLLVEFHRSYPDVEVRIVLELTQRPVDGLKDGQLDVAIVCDCVDDAAFLSRRVFSDELVVVVPPDHPLARRPYARPRDFRDENLMLHITEPEDSTILMDILAPAGVVPRKVTQVPLTEAIVQLVSSGHGISVLARWAVEPQLKAGSLVAVPITRHGFPRRWNAVFLRQEPPLPHLMKFVELAAANVAVEV